MPPQAPLRDTYGFRPGAPRSRVHVNERVRERRFDLRARARVLVGDLDARLLDAAHRDLGGLVAGDVAAAGDLDRRERVRAAAARAADERYAALVARELVRDDDVDAVALQRLGGLGDEDRA